jgi:hypothetical protein
MPECLTIDTLHDPTFCLTIFLRQDPFCYGPHRQVHAMGEAAAKAIFLNEKEPSRSPSFQKKGAR